MKAITSDSRKIVLVNQASNYLTVGFCNAFAEKFGQVALITGSIHEQGEKLDKRVQVSLINKWVERPALKKLLSYAMGAVRMLWLLKTKYRKWEVMFISIPPMSYLLGLVGNQKYSMVIWDVYPDAFKITGMKDSHPVYRLLSSLNKRAFKRAFMLFTITERMADLLHQYVNPEKPVVIPIWSIFGENEKIDHPENPFRSKLGLNGKFIVQYSGNIGLTHRVELMILLAEKLQENKNILFQIIGRGPRKPYLEKLVKEKKLPNCQFLPFQSDEMFPYSLSAADLGVVMLDSVTAKGSVPSKSYNLMSYGIPSLYVASDDSQLHVYAEKYNHARCYNETELEKAAAFITEIANNKGLWERMSENALVAAKDFKRENADLFVDRYLTLNSHE